MNLSLRRRGKKVLLLSLFIVTALATQVQAQNQYGIPTEIQEGNILHCFNWPIVEVKNELPNIAAAGFGSVQLSPLQRPDIKTGDSWHNLYRPYDLAFKPSEGMGTAEDLKSLCEEAAKYGIKVIVDIVANHVDKTAGYHDTWWDSSDRVRWNGGINYGDRSSITHGQLGDYGDINSELAEVCERGKEYVQTLKDMGVKGIRWDAAKHIGLPSEGCNFWSSVTSIPDMYHYGEILDDPGPDASIIKEYTKYMSVTDNKYCNGAAREKGGIPYGYGGKWVVDMSIPDSKMVYWAESHDTYSNDEWSQDVDQSVIDRAYAAFACRNGATALYLSRPLAKGFNNIKVGKGSTAFKEKHIAEVNKFRNAMTGKKEWVEVTDNTASITREDGGAVIVMKGSGSVSVVNGGSYCPAGTYTDQVSGGTFTVTSTEISGTVGPSGIAVIYGEAVYEPSVTLNPDGGTFSGTQTITATLKNAESGWYKIGEGEQQPFTGTATFTIGSDMNAGESVTVLWSATDGTETRTGSATYTKVDKPDVYVRFHNTNNWSEVYVWAWNETSNLTENGGWPGDKMTKEADGLYTWTLPAKYNGQTPTMIIFSDGNGNKAGDSDLDFHNAMIYDGTGAPVAFDPAENFYPKALYLIGTMNEWNTATSIAATGDNGVYTWNSVEMPDANVEGATKTFFSFLTATGASWDEVNGFDRYGAVSKDAPIYSGETKPIQRYYANNNASGACSWETVPGTYTVTADLTTYTVTLSANSSTAISNISANNGGVKAYTSNGTLYIESPKEQNVAISTVSGITTTRKVNAGVNAINGLSHGIYIINRTKVVL